MKRVYCVLLLLFSLSTLWANDERARLILHFDVNKTLIASDGVQGRSVKEVVNSLSDDPKIREKLYTQLTLSPVFQSFYELIYFLDRQDVDYTVILRTFGSDLTYTRDLIEKELGEHFFTGEGAFRRGVLVVGNEIFRDPTSSYQFFRSCENMMIQDDYSWWYRHAKSRQYGKPIFVDPNDHVLQIFFDDHIEPASSLFNIVTPIDITSGKVLSLDLLPENTACIKVNTVDAILDNSYYLNYVQKVFSTTFTFLSNNN